MEQATCPHCGSALGNDVSVCRECGKEYDGKEPAAVTEKKGSNISIYGILAVFLVLVGGAALLFYTGLIPNPFRDSTTAAIVNGQKISLQEVEQRMEIFKKMYGQGGQMDFNSPQGKAALASLRMQVLQTLVQEQVLLTEAVKENITVSKQELAEKLSAIKKSMNISDADFENFLKNHAMTRENLEKRMENEALINKLLAKGTQEKGLTREEWLKQLNSRAKVEILAK